MSENEVSDFFLNRRPGDFRSQVNVMEETMLQMPQVDTPITNHFSDGVYGREMFIPAGTTVTGKIHRTHHLSILLVGKITVVTEQGTETLTAPQVMVSPPNTKRAVYAHTDCRWIAIHGTHETDLEKLEAELITPEYLTLEESKKVGEQ